MIHSGNHPLKRRHLRISVCHGAQWKRHQLDRIILTDVNAGMAEHNVMVEGKFNTRLE